MFQWDPIFPPLMFGSYDKYPRDVECGSEYIH